MPGSFPETVANIERERTPTGMRFVLPPRIATPGTRLVGGGIVLFGLTMAVFACAWMWMPLQWALKELAPAGPEAVGPGFPQLFRIVLIAFAAFGLFPFTMGLAMILAGVALMVGGSRCQVEIDQTRLIVRESLGRLRWSFRRTLVDLNGLRLRSRSGPDSSDSSGPPELVATCGRGRPLWLGAAYPVHVLRSLAAELSRDLPQVPYCDELPTPVASLASHAQPVTAAEPPAAVPVPDPGPPPAGVTCEPRPGGLTLDVAAPGVWKGARFFLLFASFWLFMTAVLTLFIVIPVMLGKPLKTDGMPLGPWFLVLFFSVFWIAGLAVLGGAIHIGTRRTTLIIGEGLLALTVASRLHRSHRQWPLDQVRGVDVGPSGATSNERTIPCLRLQVGGQTIKTLTTWNQNDEPRLDWIAAVLSAVLGRRTEPLATAPAEMPASLQLDSGQDDWTVVPVFVAKDNGALSGLFMALFMLGFVGGFLALLLLVIKADGAGLVMAFAILGLFAVFGFAQFGWSLWSLTAKRRVAIIAGTLHIKEGRRRLDLDRSEVLAVICEPNGTTMNDQKFYRLAVQRRDGGSWTCLSSRPEAEVRWLAAELNRRLGLPK